MEGVRRLREADAGGGRWYDALSLILLMWPATGGMFWMGSTRVWGYAPGLVLSLLGSLLVVARPLFFRDTPAWRWPPGILLFAILVAHVAASLIWAQVKLPARWEALRWFALLAAVFSWTQLAGRPHRWKWLLGVLLLAVTLNSLYALIQHVNGSTMVLWMPRPEQYGMRASGTYICPNHFANMLAMLFPLALLLLGCSEAGVPLRLLSLYFLGVSTPVLYWTQSRSGWLGMVAGVGTALLLMAWRRSRAWFLLALVALPLLGAGLGLAAWKTLPAVRDRVGAVLENPEKAGGIRMKMWRDAPAMFRDRPWLGFGGGSYVWVYPPYQHHVDQHLHWDFPHNEYLHVLLEFGAVGLGLGVLALLVCGWGIASGVRNTRSPARATLLAGAGGALAACLAHALFDFNFHIFPNPHALVWIGGVAWGVAYAQDTPRSGTSRRRLLVRRWGGGLAALLCAWAAWLALSAGLSYAWNLRAEMARTRMDWHEVESDYHQSIRWDNWNWLPHQGLGNFKATQALWYRDPDLEAERREKRRLAEEAVGHFEEALKRNPLDMASEFGLARALNAMGDSEAALLHFRRAADYQHRHVFYREQLGIQLRRLGREADALEVFRQNVADGVHTDVSTLNIRALERRMAAAAAAAAEEKAPPAPE